MPQIWVREFTGGLDSRRLPETTPGGVLIQGEDGHITRGGEFEKRLAFVKEYTLPTGVTVGLAYTRLGIVVFGSEPDPLGLPVGVSYQQLQHEDGTTPLVDVTSSDLYGGKLYAVGRFQDGSQFHYYDGVRVEDWADGRARASFSVVTGVANGAVPAIGQFTVTGGTNDTGNEIAGVTVNGIPIISAAVAHTGDNATTADAVVTEINGTTSVPNYTAYAVGAAVFIVADSPGAASNGFAVAVTVAGDVTVGGVAPLAGGSDNATSTLNSITVNGQAIIISPVAWSTDGATMAAAIADAINDTISEPEYEAVATGTTVVILAAEQGSALNGAPVALTVSNGLTVTPTSGLIMSGGADAEDTFQPGDFVKTIGSKMYSTSGPNMHFSGIAAPTRWTTDVTGAGFIDMSTQASGSERLIALAKYQNYVAVFSEFNIQIWYVDPDPTLNRIAQVLNNTGSASPHSVTQFGDNDLFYLDESGLRSLRARDSSNAASTTDIGIPVDTLVQEVLRPFSTAQRERIFGVIEPGEGRFWLTMGNVIFVFSYFSGAKVSAWSRYHPGFNVERAVVFNRRVYLRSGDDIYVYGGLEGDAYDDIQAVAQIPYLDADRPTLEKQFTSVDAAASGDWQTWVLFDPGNPDAKDKVGVINGSTFRKGKITGLGRSTHISMLFKSQGTGPAKLGSVLINYEGGEDEG